MPNMLLSLVNVIVTLWVSWAHGQGRTCDFPEIKHGSIYEEHRYKQAFPVAPGKYFYYSCDRSFASPSQSLWTRITCTEDGWSPTPRCLRQCFFPWVKHGRSASSGQTHQEGDTVPVVCDEGYSLPLHQSSITCGERGWSMPPMCSRTGSRRKCGRPPTINNGDITTFPSANYAPGDSVQYRCQAYYKLQGNRILTCRDGEWSEPPKCLEACVTSEEMMEKHNIQLRWRQNKKLYIESDDTVEFTCRRGYRAVSPRSAFRVTCRAGKLTYPTCE
ncbi:complement factor H-related protein 2-like isoform X3 [Phyllostomus discolor]|uniref:Complement factor H-related protein 2-like isoform X1 n=1 Tax=Phyllostomus discolor TaxID=89673 RepID=A0A7E6D163_9CHIR|nr:complement factor H-related protein 2-like isoform X1 [Phyllostomus discolor]XP_035872129.1 complement factor H-related protein 2-like isoform X3 [Phyllostomus discolor]